MPQTHMLKWWVLPRSLCTNLTLKPFNLPLHSRREFFFLTASNKSLCTKNQYVYYNMAFLQKITETSLPSVCLSNFFNHYDVYLIMVCVLSQYFETSYSVYICTIPSLKPKILLSYYSIFTICIYPRIQSLILYARTSHR